MAFSLQANEKAADLAVLRESARQCNADAQLWLGFYCYRGKGVEKNLDEAVKWYRKAAAQGNAEAKKALEKLGRE